MRFTHSDVTVGTEFEIAGNGTAVLDILYNRGLVGDNCLHPYHCGQHDECTACGHTNYGPDGEWLWSPQEDPTVSAEFPSKVLAYGSDRMYRAFDEMERACAISGAHLGHSSGMHVHVVKVDKVAAANHVTGLWPHRDEQYDDGRTLLSNQRKTEWRLVRMFVRYQDDLRLLAAGARDSVRSYNEPLIVRQRDVFWGTDIDNPIPHGGYVSPNQAFAGRWLNTWGHDATYEFRLWNATASAWRQHLAVGTSVAMVLAAADGVDVTRDDERQFIDVVGPYMDADTVASYIRQTYHKGGVQ